MKRTPTLQICKIHPNLRSYVGYGLHRVALRLRQCIDIRMAPHGIVAAQFGILKMLTIERTVTQNELCAHMGLDKSTMVRMIDGLEQRDLVQRKASKEDRRAKHLEITKSGEKLLKVLKKLRDQAELEFLAPLSKGERQQLVEIIEKLL